MTRARVRAAVIGAALAAAFVVAVYAVRPLPLVVLRALGVHGGLDLRGGLAMRYQLPAGVGPDLVPALAGRLALTHPAARLVMTEPGVIDVEIPGIAPDAVDYTADVLAGGGVEFHAVISMAEPMLDLYTRVADDPRAKADGVRGEVDEWSDDASGQRHSDVYLIGPTRKAIEDVIAASRIALPAGTTIAFQQVDHEWRSYVIEHDAELDGWSIDNATVSFNEYTGRPEVVVELDRAGAATLGALTTRLVGKKLAILLAGTVVSAPIVNGPIRGGRLSITMGGTDPEAQDRDARALSQVLALGAFPRGGVVRDARYVAPTVTATQLWLARGLLGLAAGAVVLVVMIAIGRRATPAPRAFPTAPTRAPPWRALAVTLAAPVACVVTAWIEMPGLDRIAARGVAIDPDRVSDFGAFALGLGPLIAAFIVVELVALAVPSLRALRVTPRGRRRLGVAVVILAIAIGLIQGVLLVRRLRESAQIAGPLLHPGTLTTVVIALTCAAATFVLGAVAATISEYGLGNGFSAVTASAIVVAAVRDAWWNHPGAGLVIAGVAGMVLAAAATGWLATRRFGTPGPRGEPVIAAPIAGLLPLVWTVAAIAVIGIGAVIEKSPPRGLLPHLLDPGWMLLVVVPLGLGLALGWVLVSPRRLAGRLARMTATKVAPDVRAWVWAAIASAAWIALLVAVTRLAPDGIDRAVWSAIGGAIIAAAVLDHVAEWRARRRAELVAVWPLHDAAMADVALRVLARAGITAHLRGRHHRTLFHVFGPFIPIEVMVPAGRAGEASAMLRDMFDPASRGLTTAW